ncbi:MAG: phosphoglycerol geranylgeranyltransferase [Bacteroidetes bacterium]|nr:phosphoglycerol geranylgeranyltransferase [Bacteroidota bacterium]
MAVLIDPDKTDYLAELVTIINQTPVDFVLVGGSKLTKNNFSECVLYLKTNLTIPVIIFPGGYEQIDRIADAILLPSVLSGRNADYLIGIQTIMAPKIAEAKLEVISTGYLLIDGRKNSSTLQVTQTKPIAEDDYNTACDTALAGEMLGMKLIYLEAGSGAEQTVNSMMIEKVKSKVSIPLLVGGGINSPEKAIRAIEAGADVIVVGNALEVNPGVLRNICNAIKKSN